jgi:hypothetical protein
MPTERFDSTRPLSREQAEAVFGEITDTMLLTVWEAEFIDSVEDQGFDPTDRQQEILDRIEAELPQRRDLARRGMWPIRV